MPETAAVRSRDSRGARTHAHSRSRTLTHATLRPPPTRTLKVYGYVLLRSREEDAREEDAREEDAREGEGCEGDELDVGGSKVKGVFGSMV